MNPLRKLPAVAERVESGPVQFGDDWPGLFLRGDDAAPMAMLLQSLMNTGSIKFDAMGGAALDMVCRRLASCDARVLGKEGSG